MKTLFLSPLNKISLAVLVVSLFAAHRASAVMVTWVGTNGVSADVNWSDPANWYQINTTTEISPVANAANFTFWTAVQSPGITTVNVDGAYNTPGSGFAQSYGGFFGQTNGYHTVFIQPGIIWAIQASGSSPVNGTQGIGILVGPSQTNNNNINQYNTVSTGITYTNYTTITGIGGALYCDAGANTGGLRVEAASTVVNNHYSILDMSGLGTFYMTNITGLSSSEGFYVVNGGQNSQALVYLAMTNAIFLNNDFLVGYLGSSSNSLPVGVYLGQSNYISTGANSNYFLVGYTGCTNAFLRFNPNLLGGATMPTAYITGTSANQTAQICNAAGGQVPGYAICDFTGGTVTWIGNVMKIGVSGASSPNTSATGILTFNAGTVDFNTLIVGSQTVSAGSPGVGTINIGTNATLEANTSITLGATTGTANPATAGTINVNTNGAIVANTITNGGAGSTINMTNGILSIGLSSVSVTNITVSNFNAQGSSNVINITSIPLFLAGGFPARFHLISTAGAANLVGASTFVLGSLPTSPNTNYPYAGHIDTSTPGLVDFVLTAGPPSVRSLTWSGTNASGPDGIWDVGTNADWLVSGAATVYNQLDLVTFDDVTPPAQTSISLTTPLTPSSVTVSNAASIFTLGLPGDSGYLAGSTGFTKADTGTLIIDNGESNSFTGPVIINGGTLQVGNNDTSGNLPAGVAITDNSILAYDRVDNVTVGNIITGSGGVVSEGGGTLKLSGANSFSGVALATNNSILQSGAPTAWGSANNAIVVANGSTYDPNGFPTTKPVIVSGTGVNSQGAIVNSGGPIYDSSQALSPSITLAGDTLFTFPTRWDYGLENGPSETLSTGGQPYNLTLNGLNNSYFEWRFISADPAMANITVTGGQFGIIANTTLGSTNYSLNILSYASTKFYTAGGYNVVITKPVVLQDAGTIYNESGINTLAGPLTLTNANGNMYCVLDVVANSLTVTGPLSGNGILWMQSSTGPLIIDGNASAFTGGVLINPGGIFTLNNTIGSGITNASGSLLSGDGVANGYVDVSGAFLPGGSNIVGTFTVATGMTLEPTSTTIMNLSATTAVGGSHNSLVAVTGNLTANGSLLINPIGTLVNGTYTLMTYTGTLNGAFGSVQTTAPSSYTLTLETNTPGEVQLLVAGAPEPASFVGPFTFSSSGLTLMGTGGTPSGTYRVYAATNIATPITNWTLVGSGSFDAGGNFNFITTQTNSPERFFILEEP